MQPVSSQCGQSAASAVSYLHQSVRKSRSASSTAPGNPPCSVSVCVKTQAAVGCDQPQQSVVGGSRVSRVMLIVFAGLSNASTEFAEKHSTKSSRASNRILIVGSCLCFERRTFLGSGQSFFRVYITLAHNHLRKNSKNTYKQIHH